MSPTDCAASLCVISLTLIVICVGRLLSALFYVLFVCICVLPPGDNPIAVNKNYIISRKLVNEEALAHWGGGAPVVPKQKKSSFSVRSLLTFWHRSYTFKF
jgi:hypothetical protein